MRVIEREEERKIWLKKAFGLLILILLLLTFSRLLYIYSVQLMRTHMENFFRRFSFLVHTEKEEEEKKKGTKRVFLYSILANDVKSMGVHGIFFFQSFFISFFFGIKMSFKICLAFWAYWNDTFLLCVEIESILIVR